MAINTFLVKSSSPLLLVCPHVQFGTYTGRLPVAARFITVEFPSHYWITLQKFDACQKNCAKNGV